MLYIILMIIITGVSLAGYFGFKKEDKFSSLASLIAGGILSVILTFVASYYILDEGEAGVLRKFGKVYSIEVTSGFRFASPVASVVKWPIRLQSTSFSLPTRTNDDMQLDIDVQVMWSVDPSKLIEVYKTIAQDRSTLFEGFVVPSIRSAVRDEIGLYKYTEINSNRKKLGKSVFEYVKDKLAEKHILIGDVQIRKITPPQTVDEAVQMKMKAQQDTEAAEYTLEKTKVEARIKVEEAKGLQQAQAIINSTLTPSYLQHEGIQMMEKLANSNNTTFVFVPTGDKSAGVPLILNGSGPLR